MIKKEERKRLKKLLNANYAKEVGELLIEMNVKSRMGKPYSSSMIRRVLNGYIENAEIEAAILKVYIQRKEKKEQEILSKRKILGLE